MAASGGNIKDANEKIMLVKSEKLDRSADYFDNLLSKDIPVQIISYLILQIMLTK